MEGSQPAVEWFTFGWRLIATLAFVLLNGFFVAAEFALVKVRAGDLSALAERGSAGARVAARIHDRLDHYLSACQLGITLASLILGYLAEPAIAELLLAGAVAAGFELAPHDPLLHGAALAAALAVVTALHMTLGEQAPKILAIQRATPTAVRSAYPLWLFAEVFRPFIWAINGMSNGLLRLAGVSSDELHEGSYTMEELQRILVTSAEAGHISHRQLELVRNVLDIIGLEVRHILVPRVDVVFLSLRNTLEENVRILRESGHSRFPLCREHLDTVIGIVHAKQVLAALADGRSPDLEALAHEAVFVSDTQPLSRFIVQLQQATSHCCVVVDEHGTSIGLAFLEDALEEIVGPIHDEFDVAQRGLLRLDSGALELPGSMALPEAADLLELAGLGDESDTIGGHVVALLGRLPRKGDQLSLGPYQVTVLGVGRHRVERLRFQPVEGGEA